MMRDKRPRNKKNFPKLIQSGEQKEKATMEIKVAEEEEGTRGNRDEEKWLKRESVEGCQV